MKSYPADLQVTLQDVADASSVHRSTASRALDPTQSAAISPATVARVRAEAARLGYTPDLVAAGLKRGTTRSVGVVVSDLDNPYNGMLIRGLASVLEREGLVAFVSESIEDRERLARIVDHLVGRRVDAIVMTAAWLSDAELLVRVAASVPVVLGVGNLPGSGLPAILHDDREGGTLAAAHFLNLGHKAVAQLLGPSGIDTFVCRREGFGAVVAEHPGVTDLTLPDSAAGPTLAEGERLMRLLLDQPPDRRPTAVFAHNDLMAVGALKAITAAGLACPADISLIGYNDIPLVSALSPPLTTVSLPSLEVGREIGERVLRTIAEPNAPAGPPTMLSAKLLVRGSTAPPATSG